MKKYFITAILFLLFFFQCAVAQYYHKDIISINQANTENALLQQQKIQHIMVHSFDADGTPGKDFSCEKKLSRDFRTVKTITGSPGIASSEAESYFNEKNQLIKSVDSSEITASSTVYEYDSSGKISRITSYNHSSDDDFSTSLKEVHQYIYNSKGSPEKMLKIKNDRDTTPVFFTVDEKGNITDEVEAGINGRHYYYYYNEKNQLTDIVRYHLVKKGMRADFVFEYNSKGQLIQMVSVEEGVPGNYYEEKDDANYYTWLYFYNDEGLRIIEKCYLHKSKLLGYVEYEYE